MAMQAKTRPERTMRDTLMSPSLRRHLLIVGALIFVAGSLTLWLLPDVSVLWVIVGVVIVAHIGLLMVIGSAILRWAAGRHSNN